MYWSETLSLKKGKKKNQYSTANLMLRLVLRHGETYRLPATSQGIQVVSGIAWTTVGGRDFFLGSGERLPLGNDSKPVLVSGLGHMPLILEVLGSKATAAVGGILAAQPHRPGPI
jgi:hypothetical protein